MIMRSRKQSMWLMFSLLMIGFIVFVPGRGWSRTALAQTFTPAPFVAPTPDLDPLATTSAVATDSSATATPAANFTQRLEDLEQKRGQDITETGGQVKSRLVRLLEENPVGPLSWHNFVQHALRRAVTQGVPANVLVLLLLFPVLASLVAVSRHVIGLEGFGVYAPAVLAVVFLSTGIITGLFLFTLILLVASAGRPLLRRLHLQYLPRTALLLWLVTFSVFGLMLLAPQLLLLQIDLITLSIFPILVLILLSENFLEALLSSSQSRAIEVTGETIILAIVSTVLVRTEMVQEFVILHPEITALAVLILDVAVGKYTGLRLSEYLRFKPIMDEQE